MIDDRPDWTVTLTVNYQGDGSSAANGNRLAPGSQPGAGAEGDRFRLQMRSFRCLQALTAVHQMGLLYAKDIARLPRDAIIEITARRRLA